MKILICTAFKIPHIGGASTHIEMLSDKLKTKNLLFKLIDGNFIKGNLLTQALYVIRRVINKDKARVFYLNEAVKKLSKIISENINSTNQKLVIHCHDPIATCAALHATKGVIPVLQTVHGPWSKENQAISQDANSLFNKKIINLEYNAYKYSNKLIPVDLGQKIILAQEFNVEEDRLTIIENAIDCFKIKNMSNEVLNIVIPEFYFLIPRRLVPKNGVEYAIRAFSKLNKKDTKLFVAGDGPLLNKLKLLTVELNISDQVVFLGDVPRNQLMPLMKKSLAVIVPSVPFNGIVEATSLAVLEGMACEVPVIGSDIGGIKDIIGDDRYGLLVEPGNPESIASAMQLVFDMNTESRSCLVNAAFKRIEERFGIDKWIDKFILNYVNALTKNNY